ncbi:hypothetical protein FB451DRAFT_1007505, partial [Mycena latifolia]
GASRTELLAWLNELLQINYIKAVRAAPTCRCSTRSTSMCRWGRVEMGAYEYVANHRIMQNIFKANKIDKPIPVEKLIQCKMQ